ARLGARRGQLDQLRSLHMAQQASRLVPDPQVPQAVAGVVPGEPSGKACSYVLHPQLMHKEGAELVRPLRHAPRPLPPPRIVEELVVWCTIAVHEPEGLTIASAALASRISISRRARARAAGR